MQVYVGRRCNLRGVRKQTDRQTDKQLARIWSTNMENVRAYMEILPNESSPGKRDAKRTEFLPMAKKIKQKKANVAKASTCIDKMCEKRRFYFAGRVLLEKASIL